MTWTAVDTDGFESNQQEAERTPVDAHGYRLEIYGSAGGVFESPQAR